MRIMFLVLMTGAVQPKPAEAVSTYVLYQASIAGAITSALALGTQLSKICDISSRTTQLMVVLGVFSYGYVSQYGAAWYAGIPLKEFNSLVKAGDEKALWAFIKGHCIVTATELAAAGAIYASTRKSSNNRSDSGVESARSGPLH